MTDHTPKTEIDFTEVVEAAQESILITDINLESPGPTVIYANPAFEMMTGWSRTEILGKSPRILQGPNTDLESFSDLKEKLRSGSIWEGQTINYKKDGSEFWMEWSIVPLKDQAGTANQYLAIQRDVSARVEAALHLQQAQEAESRAQQARANLSRYFSPKLVELLAEKDQPLGEVRRQNVAVLFADIIGFTKLSEILEPEQVIALLREIHHRTEQIIFKWEGSIEGYIGDATLAVFGFPETGESDASNALACSFDLLTALQSWNKERVIKNLDPIHVGIGINYGPVVLGDVGAERYLEFTIIGDTVNIASRLQQVTREFQCDMVVSQELVSQVKEERAGDQNQSLLLDQLSPHGHINLRGRSGSVEVFTHTCKQ